MPPKINTGSCPNDSLGRVTEEKIKASSKQGTGIFESKTKVITEYKYSYDQYGNRTTTYENEIYHEVSSNPLGTIIKAVIGIATVAFTFGQSIWITAAWMAAENFPRRVTLQLFFTGFNFRRE